MVKYHFLYLKTTNIDILFLQIKLSLKKIIAFKYYLVVK